VTTVSITRNNSLRRPVSLCQLPPLYNKKIKNRSMFMRYTFTIPQGLEVRSAAAVVEFSQRSNRFKLPDTHSIICKKALVIFPNLIPSPKLIITCQLLCPAMIEPGLSGDQGSTFGCRCNMPRVGLLGCWSPERGG
jgi:hypothetical protein